MQLQLFTNKKAEKIFCHEISVTTIKIQNEFKWRKSLDLDPPLKTLK